jgi:hypothetical protein
MDFGDNAVIWFNKGIETGIYKPHDANHELSHNPIHFFGMSHDFRQRALSVAMGEALTKRT